MTRPVLDSYINMLSISRLAHCRQHSYNPRTQTQVQRVTAASQSVRCDTRGIGIIHQGVYQHINISKRRAVVMARCLLSERDTSYYMSACMTAALLHLSVSL